MDRFDLDKINHKLVNYHPAKDNIILLRLKMEEFELKKIIVLIKSRLELDGSQNPVKRVFVYPIS